MQTTLEIYDDKIEIKIKLRSYFFSYLCKTGKKLFYSHLVSVYLHGMLHTFATTIKNVFSGNISFPRVHAEITTVKNIANGTFSFFFFQARHPFLQGTKLPCYEEHFLFPPTAVISGKRPLQDC